LIDVRDWYTGAARFRYASDVLKDAPLRDARLRYADLRGADLKGVDLRGADLRGALLWKADLRGANLTSALLGFFESVEGRYDSLADLTGANLWGAVYDRNTRWPAGFAPGLRGAVEAEGARARPIITEPAAEQSRTFVVGDVHGHADKLRALLRQLQELARPGDALVFLGDYIDRGPDSRGVIDLALAQMDGCWEGSVTALKGNHEDMLLYCLETDPAFAGRGWFQYGGLETLDSYAGEDWPEDWMDLLPPAHVAFLRGLKRWHQDANGIYVHAGLRPGQAPEEAGDETLLWIREKFYGSDFHWEKVVVFGHTPHYEPLEEDLERPIWRPMNRPEKIGIDTGAGFGGPVTAVLLPERQFVSAS
jgi:uncharacterized protein YjbI with pentapeptide repeats